MGEKDIFPRGRTSIMGDPGLIPGGYGHPCLWCGEPSPRESFCSDSCQDRFMSWLQTEPASLRGVLPPFWNIIRRSALQRDGYRCQVCGGGTDLSVHHVIPLSAGGDSTPGNLRVLCRSCHQREHGRPAEPRKRRFRVRIRHQPMYVPASRFGDWIRSSCPDG